MRVLPRRVVVMKKKSGVLLKDQKIPAFFTPHQRETSKYRVVYCTLRMWNATYTTSTQTLFPLSQHCPEVGEEGLCMSVY